MANEVIGTSTIIVQGDFTSLTRSANRALDQIEQRKLNPNFTSFRPLGQIGRDITQIEKSLEAANARVIAFGASAVIFGIAARTVRDFATNFIEVEKALTAINVVLNVSSSGIKKFGDEIFKTAANTGTSFAEAAEAAQEFSRQGLSVEATLARTNAALVLSRLSGLDAAKSVASLTAAINSFSREALTQEEIVNKLANVDSKFAVSSKDLAESLSRSGEAAQGAGVSFNELIALTTALQQRTARGGAVIGNALKTIFTRTQRSGTLNELEELGIAVREVGGKTLPAIQILQNLANVQDDLSDSQRNFIEQLIGGGFQINQLKAGLSDLSKENGIFAQSLKVASETANEAFDRNKLLNESLSALGNTAAQNAKRLSAAAGERIFAPSLRTIFNEFNEFSDFASGDSDGKKLGEAFVKGFGDFLAGPGGIIIVSIFAKLIGRMIGDLVKGIALLGNLTKALGNIPAIQSKILSNEDQRIAKNQSILGLINSQNALLARQGVSIAGTRFSGATPVNNASNAQNGLPILPIRTPFAPSAPLRARDAGSVNPNIATKLAENTAIRNDRLAQAAIARANIKANRLAFEGRNFLPPTGLPTFNRDRVNGRLIADSFLGRGPIAPPVPQRQVIRSAIRDADFNRKEQARLAGIRAVDETRQRVAASRDGAERLARANAVINPQVAGFLGARADRLANGTNFLNGRFGLQGRNAFTNGTITGALGREINVGNKATAALGFSLGGNILGQAIGGKKGEAISGASNAIGTGAAILALSPNVIGVAVAGVVTSLGLLKTGLDFFRKDLSQVVLSNDRRKDDNQRSAANSDKLINTLSQIRELDASATPEKREDLQKQLRSAIIELSPAALQALRGATGGEGDLAKVKDLPKLIDALNLVKTNEEKESKRLTGLSTIIKLTESGKPITNPDAIADLSSALRSTGIFSDLSDDRLNELDDEIVRNRKIAGKSSFTALSLNSVAGLDPDIAKKFAEALGENSAGELRKLIGDERDRRRFSSVFEKANTPQSIPFNDKNFQGNLATSSTDFNNKEQLRKLESELGRDFFDSVRSIQETGAAQFSNPLGGISRETAQQRREIERQAQERRFIAQTTSRNQIEALGLGIGNLGLNNEDKLGLSKLVTSGLSSSDPTKALADIAGALAELKLSDPGDKTLIDINKILAGSQTELKAIQKESNISNIKLTALENLNKRNIAINKVTGNFRGVNALNTPQDLSDINAGRAALNKGILERDNPLFQQQLKDSIRGGGNSAINKTIARRAELQARSDAIGRGIIAGFESGAIPTEDEAVLFDQSNQKDQAKFARALNKQNRDRLAQSFFSRFSADIDQQASASIGQLTKDIGGQTFNGRSADGIFKQLKQFSDLGDLNSVNKLLAQLKSISNPSQAGVVGNTQNEIFALTQAKVFAGIASQNKADSIARGLAGPLTGATYVENNNKLIAAVLGNKNEVSTKPLQFNTERVDKILDAAQKQEQQTINSYSEVSAKVGVEITNALENGAVSEERLQVLSEELKSFVKEFFDTGGKPKPRNSAPVSASDE